MGEGILDNLAWQDSWLELDLAGQGQGEKGSGSLMEVWSRRESVRWRGDP